MRKMNINSLLNLKPLDTLPPDEARAIQSMGGKASGAKRRAMAEARDVFSDSLILYGMRDETRAHYQAAIKRYAKQEARKRKRRKATNE